MSYRITCLYNLSFCRLNLESSRKNWRYAIKIFYISVILIETRKAIRGMRALNPKAIVIDGLRVFMQIRTFTNCMFSFVKISVNA